MDESRRQLETLTEQIEILEEELERHRRMIQSMMNGFALHEVIVDDRGQPVDYRFLAVNPAFERLTGLERTAIIGKRATEALPGTEQDPADWIGTYGKVALEGGEVRFEQYAEALQKWFSVLAYRPAAGQFVTIFEDITERKRTEVALRESEEKFRTITEHSADALFIADREGRYLYANPAACELLGYAAEELTTKTVADLTVNSDEQEVLRGHADLVRAGHRQVEVDLRHKDGSIVHADLNTVVLPNGTVCGSCRDVTERKHAAERLAASERRFRSLFEHSLAPIAIADDAGRYLDVNAAACEMFGYDREQLLSMTVGDLVTPMPQSAGEQFERYKEAPNTSGEFAFVRRDGEERFALWSAAAIDTGQYASVLRDITDRKRAEEELRRSEAKLQSIVDSSPFPVAVIDRPDDEILYWSRSAVEMFGHTARTTAAWNELAYPDSHYRQDVIRRWNAALAEAAAGARSVNAGQYRITCHDGSVRLCELHATYTAENLIVFFNDITERTAMEAQLAQADRLSSMGTLAAGVAHEINNPLTFVLQNLESLAEDLPRLVRAVRQAQEGQAGRSARLSPSAGPGDEAEPIDPDALDDMVARFEDALIGSRRIGDIASGLSAFSRVETERPVAVNLPDVIEMATRIAANEIKYRAVLTKDYGPTPAVLAHPGRLSQVFLNLLINAAHAIDEGDVQNNEIRVRAWTEAGHACAEVRDTGRGIAPEHLDQVFEPFFTTKEGGSGSGLGLSISRTIVEKYDGAISVHGHDDGGTSFTVRLPRAPRAAAAPESEAGSSAGTEAAGRILIVDDEPGVRATLARLLRGHVVVQAASGVEARRILEQDQGFQLIFCDVMMPELPGIELHRWLAAEHPQLAERLVFVTGGAFTPRARQYLSEVDNLQLEKPFDVVRFRQIVKERLRSAEAARPPG